MEQLFKLVSAPADLIASKAAPAIPAKKVIILGEETTELFIQNLIADIIHDYCGKNSQFTESIIIDFFTTWLFEVNHKNIDDRLTKEEFAEQITQKLSKFAGNTINKTEVVRMKLLNNIKWYGYNESKIPENIKCVIDSCQNDKTVICNEIDKHKTINPQVIYDSGSRGVNCGVVDIITQQDYKSIDTIKAFQELDLMKYFDHNTVHNIIDKPVYRCISRQSDQNVSGNPQLVYDMYICGHITFTINGKPVIIKLLLGNMNIRSKKVDGETDPILTYSCRFTRDRLMSRGSSPTSSAMKYISQMSLDLSDLGKCAIFCDMYAKAWGDLGLVVSCVSGNRNSNRSNGTVITVDKGVAVSCIILGVNIVYKGVLYSKGNNSENIICVNTAQKTCSEVLDDIEKINHIDNNYNKFISVHNRIGAR